MSDAPKLTKKQKKAAAFRDRKGKGKTKQLDRDVLDLPVEENQDFAELSEVPRAVLGSAAQQSTVDPNKAGGIADNAAPQPSKKRKRQNDTTDIQEQVDEGTQPLATKKRRKQKATAGEDTNNDEVAEGRRYILFLGNLKYTTSREAIANHFSSCPIPPSIRLLTPKPKPGAKPSPSIKSKGCAFLEFRDKISLQQALRLHHSVIEGRQINVELTAGGGGKSEGRVTKLKERNKELHTQRTKAAETRKKKGEATQEDDIETLTAGKRYSATSGVEQAPTNKRTWTVGDQEEEVTHRGGVKHAKKRGKRKSATGKSMASGMNAIPVG